MEVDETQESTSAAPRRTVRSISSKLQIKLKRAIEENNFYEAHQIYRTIYARSVGSENYPEVAKLLREGALMLLCNGQLESGADLAMLFLEALEKNCGTIPDEHVDVLAEFHRHMHRESPERQKFLAQALKLSARSRQTSMGSPELHARIAKNLWEEKDYVAARYHFLRSNDGQGCGLMLVEFHVTLGYSVEVDLFIAQTVFQYLCLMKDTGVANVTLAAYCCNHPSLRDRSGPPYYLPLLNFVWLLLLTIQSRTLTWFSILCDKYKPVLNCDPSYFEYLDRIGQIFFGLRPPPQQRPGGVFGNLMSSIFGSMADSDDSEEDGQQSSSNVASGQRCPPRQIVQEDDLD